MIELKVDQTKLVERILRRAQETAARGEAVRKDDDPEVFKTRLEAFNRDTAVVAPYYAERGLLVPDRRHAADRRGQRGHRRGAGDGLSRFA